MTSPAWRLTALLLIGSLSACHETWVVGDGTPLVVEPHRPRKIYRAGQPSFAEPPSSQAAQAPPGSPPETQPTIDAEPEVRLLVARGETVNLQLIQSAAVGQGRMAPGRYSLYTVGDRLAVRGSAPLVTARLDLDVPQPPAGPVFKIGSREYGGCLSIIADRGRVLVLERLPLERYLIGVLSREVDGNWPLEALKAQAIAARSYAAAQLIRRRHEHWQLGASEIVDMAYAAYQADPPAGIVRAVRETRGQMLYYANQPLPAYFHAASGGHTESMAQVWPDRRSPDGVTDPSPAMPAVPDPHAAAGVAVAPRRLGSWRAVIPWGDLLAKLDGAGHPYASGQPMSIRVASWGEGERAQRVRVETSAGRTEVSAADLRLLVDPRLIRSTLWTRVAFSARNVVIEGRGFGHGVGLPQASAWAMARAGYHAPAILERYYPKAQRVTRYP